MESSIIEAKALLRKRGEQVERGFCHGLGHGKLTSMAVGSLADVILRIVPWSSGALDKLGMDGRKVGMNGILASFHSGLAAILISAGALHAGEPASLLPGGPERWKLVWDENFDHPDAELDESWNSQNGPSGHILCSRWRENAVVANGMLRLVNRKEKRGGQEWTSGSLTSKRKFQYGYFECRYRYAAAEGTNNSFWLMTVDAPRKGKRFEIDINEGHYPNEINTNIHNWSDIKVVNGRQTHPSSSRSFQLGLQADHRLQLEIPVTTRRLRFSSRHSRHFHIGEFQVYAPNAQGYPSPYSPSADRDKPGLVNLARDPKTQIRASGFYQNGKPETLRHIADGNPGTSWISQAEGGKWIEFIFPEERTIGCVQFLNGWKSGHKWNDLIHDWVVSWHDGQRWVEMGNFDLEEMDIDLARDFHVYGLEWTPQELVFYHNGREMRREKNEFCHSPSPVWLSLAIIPWAGKVTDKIHGTFMEVDYVRVFESR